MIDEKAITPESDANISQVILGFKLLDYDETAISTTMKLLKNPIILMVIKLYYQLEGKVIQQLVQQVMV
mgnify:CR=1 FL=1